MPNPPTYNNGMSRFGTLPVKKQKTPEQIQAEIRAQRAAQMQKEGNPVGFKAGIEQGRDLSKELTGADAINAARADQSPEQKALVAQAMEQAKGLSSDQNQALINQGRMGLIAQQVGAMRNMRGTLAANGVRGGAAAGAQAGVAAQGANALGQFYNQNVINNVQAQQTGLANASKVVGQQDASVADLLKNRGKVVLGIGDIGQTNSTSLLQAEQADAAAKAQKEAAGGGSVICSALYARGELPEEIWRADESFGATRLHPDVLIGYRAWAGPLSRSPVAVTALAPIAKGWAYHMAFLQGVHDKPNFIGRILLNVGAPICRALGRVIRWLR